MIFLDPAQANFRRNPAGTLDLTAAGTTTTEVSCVPMFPLRDPERLISIVKTGEHGFEEVAVVQELRALPPDQQSLVRDQIRFRCFVPVILDVLAITLVADYFELELLTDRGPVTILVENPRESLTVTDDGIMIITDLEKCRYRIGNLAALPLRARLQLEKILL